MKSQIEIAKMMLLAKVISDTAARLHGKDVALSNESLYMSAGMLCACNWILFGGEDPPGLDKISDAEAFACLERIKDGIK